MKLRALGLRVLSSCVALGIGMAGGAAAALDAERPAPDCAVLLHGLGRTALSMRPLARHLEKAGYHTVNMDYPSTSAPIEVLATVHVPQAIAQCGESPRIHFVTHSLGGILVRYYLQQHALPSGSRVVMLAPPNQGSEVADHFKDDAWYRWWTGPAGQQLGTDSASLPRSLGPVKVEVGIIAGRDSFDPWFSPLIPGEDDGKVAVEHTKLPEMADFLVVDSTHPFIMSNPTVMEQVRHFLASGRFRAEPVQASATGSH